MAASRSLKTLKITLSTEVVCCSEIPGPFSRRSRRPPGLESELPGGDAAEGHTAEIMPAASASRSGSRRPAPAGPSRSPSAHDGPHSVEHIPGRQVIGTCQLGPAGGLRAALGPHNFCALVPELEPAAEWMALSMQPWRGEAPQQGGVVRIHNGVRPRPGDVPLPEHQAGISCSGRQGIPVHHALFSRSAESRASWTSEIWGPGHGRRTFIRERQPPLRDLIRRK